MDEINNSAIAQPEGTLSLDISPHDALGDLYKPHLVYRAVTASDLQGGKAPFVLIAALVRQGASALRLASKGDLNRHHAIIELLN